MPQSKGVILSGAGYRMLAWICVLSKAGSEASNQESDRKIKFCFGLHLESLQPAYTVKRSWLESYKFTCRTLNLN